jgi:hypothetical protein
MRQLEPSHYGLQLRKAVDESSEWRVPALYEYMQEQASGDSGASEADLWPFHIENVF